ncbi:MAG: hypothetical protein IH586_20380 [Anaerolineaceae bacterium]|nr:hypothetical protein [Anaerolineaceae bacterium]
MCKTGRRAEQARSIPAQVGLIFLAACLMVHFLIEDSVFQTRSAGTLAAAANLDELTHQDDLVRVEEPPVPAVRTVYWLMVAAILPTQIIARIPPHHPPKIATQSAGYLSSRVV